MALEKKELATRRFYVSVIIPTYNSAKRLDACLKSILEQGYPLKEVVVVDNYSEDETRRIARAFRAKVILHRGNQASARNVGLANSSSGFVLFLDSDQRLDADVIEDCLLTCIKLRVEAVIIPEDFIGLSFWGRCSALWKNRVVEAWGPLGGIPRFYRRDALLESKTFNEGLRFWEDLELYQRLKLAGIREAESTRHVIHYEDGSLREIIWKYVAYGRSIPAFKGGPVEAPYLSTIKLTLITLMELLRNPGRSVSVLFGCLLLVIVKSLSAALGLIMTLMHPA